MPATLPTAPAELAALLLDPTVPDTEITDRLYRRLGGPAARRLLAEAHGIAAARLWDQP